MGGEISCNFTLDAHLPNGGPSTNSSEGLNKQTNVYGFENHQTNIRWKSGGILWTYIKIGKLFES